MKETHCCFHASACASDIHRYLHAHRYTFTHTWKLGSPYRKLSSSSSFSDPVWERKWYILQMRPAFPRPYYLVVIWRCHNDYLYQSDKKMFCISSLFVEPILVWNTNPLRYEWYERKKEEAVEVNCACTHAHVHIRTRLHTHINTHTHTHKHTHTHT